MRKLTLPMLTVTPLLLAACSGYHDDAQAANKASSSDNQREIYEALEDLKQEVRSLQRQMKDGLGSSLDSRFEDVKVSIADVKHSLKLMGDQIKTDAELLENLGETVEKVRDETAKLSGLEQRATMLEGTVTTLKSAVDELKTTLAAVDLEKFLDVSRGLADMTGRAIRAEAERDGIQQLLETTNKTVEQLKTQILECENRIGQLSGSDVSKHPDFAALKMKCEELEKSKDGLQKEFDKMKGLADVQAREIESLKSGKPVPSVNDAPAQPLTTGGYEAGFRAEITTSHFFEDTKQYNLLVNLKEGSMPKVGEILVILDENDAVVCEMKVTKVFDAVQFGGSTVDAIISNAPTESDTVRRRRAVSAGGVDE